MNVILSGYPTATIIIACYDNIQKWFTPLRALRRCVYWVWTPAGRRNGPALICCPVRFWDLIALGVWLLWRFGDGACDTKTNWFQANFWKALDFGGRDGYDVRRQSTIDVLSSDTFKWHFSFNFAWISFRAWIVFSPLDTSESWEIDGLHIWSPISATMRGSDKIIPPEWNICWRMNATAYEHRCTLCSPRTVNMKLKCRWNNRCGKISAIPRKRGL